MTLSKQSSFHPVALLCTCLGVGKIPFAPGTWGSLIAFPVGFIVMAESNYWLYLSIIILFFVAGIWASRVYMMWHGKHDAKEIVIDEFVGQSLVIWLATYAGQGFQDARVIVFLWLGAPFVLFALFRFFDIVKPWPIGWVDKHIQGGIGVMLDDVAAALMTVTVFYASIFVYIDLIAK